MRILIINACPHRGNTWKLTQLVEKEILKLDSTVEFEELHLSEINIPLCCGCSLC